MIPLEAPIYNDIPGLENHLWKSFKSNTSFNSSSVIAPVLSKRSISSGVWHLNSYILEWTVKGFRIQYTQVALPDTFQSLKIFENIMTSSISWNIPGHKKKNTTSSLVASLAGMRRHWVSSFSSSHLNFIIQLDPRSIGMICGTSQRCQCLEKCALRKRHVTHNIGLT